MKHLFLTLCLLSIACKAPAEQQTKQKVPQKVLEIARFIQSTGHTYKGYVGGRKFGNYEGHLPKTENGQKIQYQEWDVHPKKKGKNRGAERLVTGSNRKVYYTKDHYNSFTELQL